MGAALLPCGPIVTEFEDKATMAYSHGSSLVCAIQETARRPLTLEHADTYSC